MALNPQQHAFKENYTNPNSETFGNAYQSALSAGFADEYAKVITAPSCEIAWVAEILNDLNRLRKAEKVLDKTLDLIDDDDANKKRIAQDSAKFIAKGLGKNKYSERQEHTGNEGGPINANFNKLDDSQLAQLIQSLKDSVGRSSLGEEKEDSGESPEVRETP